MVIGQVAVGSEIEISKNKYAREGCNKNQTFASSDEKPPNIIVIVADDLGYNDVSWHNPDIVSPNMERLAR